MKEFISYISPKFPSEIIDPLMNIFIKKNSHALQSLKFKSHSIDFLSLFAQSEEPELLEIQKKMRDFAKIILPEKCYELFKNLCRISNINMNEDIDNSKEIFGISSPYYIYLIMALHTKSPDIVRNLTSQSIKNLCLKFEDAKASNGAENLAKGFNFLTTIAQGNNVDLPKVFETIFPGEFQKEV